jgi:hypothetical protein
MTAAKPLARYSAIKGRARERLPHHAELHHHQGRHPTLLRASRLPNPRCRSAAACLT